jgi:hypothetical protein
LLLSLIVDLLLQVDESVTTDEASYVTPKIPVILKNPNKDVFSLSDKNNSLNGLKFGR